MEFIKNYFDRLYQTYRHGDAREESYYSDLKRLIEDLGEYFKKELSVTTLPKKTDAGNPDFRIWGKKGQIIGYIEAKDPKNDPLWQLDVSEQIKRYKSTFPNVILTNFFEFRLFRNGELIKHIKLGEPKIMLDTGISPAFGFVDDFISLINQFFSFSIPETKTAKALAIELAKRTHFLRDQVIAEELKENQIEGTQTLEGYYKAFKDHLISSLTLEEFSNLFAQTITYGLFVARSRANDDFNRELAYQYIPTTIGILKKVFRFISSSELPKAMEWIIDDISEVLANSNVRQIMEDYYKEGKGKDPIIHFYETFLAAYDPKEREKRGVYYTPEPVVGYIVRSVHKLLKDKFGKTDGFASQSVTVLDPAAGTLTFPAEAIRLAIEEYKSKYGSGGVNGLIKNHILKDFYAFELMMASYAIGHLKIGFVLDEYGYKLSDDERFNLFLTNTLDFTKEDPNQFPGVFEQAISKESQEALKVKENVPVMVIMGNPPYSGQSENKGDWILNQISEYRKVNGEPLGEKNPKWLQDDYVKFFRFGQWKIVKAGQGILAFISNHAWLDNPTFRGMRSSILNTFDEIFILNLHGSILKKEKTPSGEKDENVFDIQSGVAITICIKNNGLKNKKVFYSDIWGLREKKYDWLQRHDLIDTDWSQINPSNPYYFLVTKNEKSLGKYQKFAKITDIFPVNSVGVVTGRDEFVIDFDEQTLESRIRDFIDVSKSDQLIESLYNLKDKPAWLVAQAREKLRDDPNWKKCFTKILYRPFDDRWVFNHPAVVERSRENVMKNLLKPNFALLAKRQQKQEFSYAFISNKLTESCVFESAYANNSVFPLYIYPRNEQQLTVFDGQEKLDLEGVQHTLRTSTDKKPNLDIALIRSFCLTYKTDITPEQVFFYVYAILYSNTYREKYKEFLKIDFPRIPFTKDHKLFKLLSELGEQLVELHLLKSKELEYPIAKFYGEGIGNVEKREYIEDAKRVYINQSQYFDEIETSVWNYFIGGYQVLDKWLKDRKGRYLSADDVRHYCQMITSISKTIGLQKRIDKLYPKIEEGLVDLKKVISHD